MKEKILVLMSTYNGEQYIKEQIESILEQDGVNVHLLIRDDGSRDGTIEILKDYSKRYNNIEMYQGKNLGACQSFFNLMKNAGMEYDYYAFADQDDVWERDKLKAAISRIEGEEQIPVLYCGTYKLVDKELKEIPQKQTQKNISFGNALIESNCTGWRFDCNLCNIVKLQTFSLVCRRLLHCHCF